jgi:hypothetical protein
MKQVKLDAQTIEKLLKRKTKESEVIKTIYLKLRRFFGVKTFKGKELLLRKYDSDPSFYALCLNCDGLIWANYTNMVDEIAELIAKISEVINESDKKCQITESTFFSGENDIFPVLFEFFALSEFTTIYGEEKFGITRKVSISLDNLRKTKNGFSGDFLHRLAKIVISRAPIVEKADIVFSERCNPGVVILHEEDQDLKISDSDLLPLVYLHATDPYQWKKHFKDVPIPRFYYEMEQTEISDYSDDPDLRRHHIPTAVKREVWRRDKGICTKCGGRENLEFDHIIPVSKGGSNTVRNIELLCQNCNRKKSDKIV